jgi:hypothetical protein
MHFKGGMPALASPAKTGLIEGIIPNFGKAAGWPKPQKRREY